MILTDIKELKLQYDESLQLLRAEWVGSKSANNLRPALVQAQQLAKRLGATRVLAEINALPDISAYDQIWLGAHWVPLIIQLPLRQTVIVLNSDRVYNLHAIETILAMNRPFIKFDVQFFTQEAAGLHWLTNDAPQLPGLLAEWNAAHGPTPSSAGNLAEPLLGYLPRR